MQALRLTADVHDPSKAMGFAHRGKTPLGTVAP
jgi:hypothetical protein